MAEQGPNASRMESFLLGYTPRQTGFTSNEEIELVTRRLGLDRMSDEELRATRDRVVEIYSRAQNRETRYDQDGNFAGRSEKFWDYNEGLMSVTAIIDYIRRRRGTPVSML